MPRKGPAPKRPIDVDPVYGSQLVTQLDPCGAAPRGAAPLGFLPPALSRVRILQGRPCSTG